METEIRPQPDEAERAAILVALSEEEVEPSDRSAWARAALPARDARDDGSA